MSLLSKALAALALLGIAPQRSGGPGGITVGTGRLLKATAGSLTPATPSGATTPTDKPASQPAPADKPQEVIR